MNPVTGEGSLKGTSDAFVSEIAPPTSTLPAQLLFSTYLGGSADEDTDLGAIAVDSTGTFIYVTGNTDSTDFPLQSAAVQSTYKGNGDAFVVKYAQGQAFAMTATTPSPVSPGASATSTITLTAYNSYASPVNLTCAVTGTGSPLPVCSVTGANPVTPTATSTATITTTGATAALYHTPKFFYAMWLPVAGMSLLGMSFSSNRSRRKKLLGFLMIGMVMASLFLMPACGGGSSGGGGGGGGGGCTGCTPAGAYTVTITGTGTDANNITQQAQVILTVN